MHHMPSPRQFLEAAQLRSGQLLERAKRLKPFNILRSTVEYNEEPPMVTITPEQAAGWAYSLKHTATAIRTLDTKATYYRDLNHVEGIINTLEDHVHFAGRDDLLKSHTLESVPGILTLKPSDSESVSAE